MGADPDAVGLIGIKIPFDKIFKEQKIKEFEHDYSEDMNYDPVTGKKLWYTKYVSILQKYEEYNSEYKSFFVDWSDDSYNSENGRPTYLFFGAIWGKAGHDDAHEEFVKLNLNDITIAKGLLKEEFEPLGLWDESSFGLHVLFKWNT